jgi:hypothetical protein
MSSKDLSRAGKSIFDSVVKVVRPDNGTGGGFILKDGLVLTCEHVIGGAKTLAITLRDGRQTDVDVLAADTTTDLAILRPTQKNDEPLDLPPGLDLAQTDLIPGQRLAAIGHPLGLDWSITGGHYNATRPENDPALGRLGINLKTPLIQVDVTINSGNSGGPVIDLEGQVVGVATSIINPAVANSIGFAIPTETAMHLCDTVMLAVDAPPLTPYSCGHHHPTELAFCPLLGKAIKPIDQEEIHYSCGHLHPPDLEYCPGLGKPITPVNGPNGREKRRSAHCNCGSKYRDELPYCPACGKPVQPAQ